MTWCAMLAVVAAITALDVFAQAPARTLPLEKLRSGITFAGADVQAMQRDDFANPGMLWVDRGRTLWSEKPPSGAPSCAGCHGEADKSMRGVATRYPAFSTEAKRVVDLEARIDACRVRRQNLPPLAHEAEDLLALTTYVAYVSRGLPVKVAIDGSAQPAFERGRAFYQTRHGQLNMSCVQCHEQNPGKRLFAETISQGHGTAFPAYRLEWQAVGSLARRIRACLFGIRAEMPPAEAPELTEVALYLAWRAEGLPLEAPGVRR
jgi:sulfur-oxidizing protein SoxA